MTDYITQHLSLFFSISIACITTASIIFYYINQSSDKFLSFLNVKALKSSTNARLLGGLPIAVNIFLVILIAIAFDLVGEFEKSYLKLALIPIIFITAYGYLDDKLELRARHKLAVQLLSILFTLLPLQLSIHQFIIAYLFGLALMNGTNLIDGIDTLFAKIVIVLSLSFFGVGLLNHITSLILLSIATLSATLIFLKYNKEPARFYAGEIGASLFGYTLFLKSILYIYSLKKFKLDYSTKELFFICIIISLYPLTEFGITFMRRVYFKRPPFLGDHLHIHHIIKNNYKISPSDTATLIAFFTIANAFLSITVYKLTNVYFAFVFSFAIIIFTYLKICYLTWKKYHNEDLLSDLFLNISSDQVFVLDGKNIDDAFEEQFK